jgi:ATP-dependent RNA helicase DeaD
VQFHDFELSEPLLKALDDLGWTTPTPIQKGTIEHLLADRDVIGQAQTGSGKTAAFMLPILERIDAGSGDLQALVLCPTRELALQVADMSRALAANLDGVDVVPVYGGAPIREQIDRLARGAQVVVGTPGRVLDLLQRGKMVLADCRMVVLDEADEMLSMGFIDDIRAIMRRTPWGKQTALFSATMPPPIQKLAEEELHSPQLVKVTPNEIAVDTITQRVIEVEPREKLDRLEELLETERPACAIVFARTKLGCARLADELFRRGHKVRALHGDMTQSSRDSVMIAFRSRRVPLLVATDVAARGLDVSHVSHVINYELPDEPEVYVHRIGRTGRVGREGAAFSFVSRKERRKLQAIEALLRRPIPHWKPGDEPVAEGGDDADEGSEPAQLDAAPTPNGDAPAAGGEGGGDAGKRRRRGRRGGSRNRPRTPAQH